MPVPILLSYSMPRLCNIDFFFNFCFFVKNPDYKFSYPCSLQIIVLDMGSIYITLLLTVSAVFSVI